VSELIWEAQPDLASPIVIAAFEGWNDAGDGASRALDHVIERWGAQRFASIEPESFFDFTNHRPRIRMTGNDTRRIDWPDTVFWWATSPAGPDVVLIRGVEPHLRWKSFCAEILTVADSLSARLVVTLGALLADVPHTRQPTVFGTAYDPAVITALGLEPSTYEGPTGIIGVLHEQCREHGVNSASFWAAVPSYVASTPSPRAQRALVDRVAELLGTPLDTSDLAVEELRYEVEISELVAEDADTMAYVRHLEEQHDGVGERTDVNELLAEVERYLRDR